MWSYSGVPDENPKDAVRFLVGDTDQSDPLLQDGEIEYFLRQYNHAPMNAAIRCCEAIMTKFARLANETVGSVKVDFNQKYKAYREMKEDLKQRLATEDVRPYAGGISQSDKASEMQNADRVKPDFSKHMMEDQQISPWVTQNQEEFLREGDV